MMSKCSEDKVRIVFQDGGQGIEHELRAALFQSFEHLGKENSSLQRTGVGLVISRELIKLMHGELGVVSITSTGSTFCIELPIVELKEVPLLIEKN